MAAILQPVTVRIGDDSITLTPMSRLGDNPRFYAVQVEAQLEEVANRYRTILTGLFGEQS